MERSRGDKNGQATIFIIFAIFLVAGIIIYFVVSDKFSLTGGGETFSSVYAIYEQCISDASKEAIDLAGVQGGYVYVPNYDPGSDYAPTSSQLNFLGFPVPYWIYTSGNGIIREQVPTKQSMQEDIARYVREQIRLCDFDALRARGYSIVLGEPKVSVKIEDIRVLINSQTSLVVSKDGEQTKVSSREVEVSSKLGRFYDIAFDLYRKEKQEAFLENYSVDVLGLYAPVDGVEIQCSPKIWKASEVSADLEKALENNIASLRFNGRTDAENKKYFDVGYTLNSGESVRTMFSSTWPHKIEITGTNGELMIAEPVGIQEGLGILGFCYAPYHFVYDVNYPVLFQIYEGEEVFQFPIAVVIDNNLPRQGIYSELEEEPADFDVCSVRTQEMHVQVFDIDLSRVDANIYYNCFNQKCELGKSKGGAFDGFAPACVNGQLIVQADGYAESIQTLSTSDVGSVDVILDRLYGVNLSVEMDGKPWNGNAFIVFERNDKTVTAVLPNMRHVELSEGNYNVRVSIYGNTSISIPASSSTQCVDVAKGGLLGFFGAKEERCFPINIPSSKIESALIGGGSGREYLLPSSLSSGKLTFSVQSLPAPTSLKQLQYNYGIFDSRKVEVKI